MEETAHVTDVLKVGELARRTGLSVRALHHYDAIGLLSPARRTRAGHRLYGREEVERLHRIVSLKQIGLPLDEIAECLRSPDYPLERVLELQVERMDERLREQKRLRDLIQGLRDRMRTGGDLSLGELTRTIEGTMSFEKYYTPEQLKQLEERRQELGQDRIEEVQREWQDLFAAYADAMARGVDPASDEVRALAHRSAALIREFTGGDPGIASSLGRMYATEGPQRVLEGHGMQMAPGLWDYMGRARSALEEAG